MSITFKNKNTHLVTHYPMQIFNLKIIVPHFGYCDINKWKSITVLMTNTPYYVPRPWPVNLCSDQ